jgi:hypothetical protein
MTDGCNESKAQLLRSGETCIFNESMGINQINQSSGSPMFKDPTAQQASKAGYQTRSMAPDYVPDYAPDQENSDPNAMRQSQDDNDMFMQKDPLKYSSQNLYIETEDENNPDLFPNQNGKKDKKIAIPLNEAGAKQMPYKTGQQQ